MSCLLILKEEWSLLDIQPQDKILNKTLILFLKVKNSPEKELGSRRQLQLKEQKLNQQRKLLKKASKLIVTLTQFMPKLLHSKLKLKNGLKVKKLQQKLQAYKEHSVS